MSDEAGTRSALTGKQRRHLRALGHQLQPLVRIGKAGVTESLVETTRRELETHELIKVRVLESAGDAAREVAAFVASVTGAEVVQILGSTILLYRASDTDPQIELPRG